MRRSSSRAQARRSPASCLMRRPRRSARWVAIAVCSTFRMIRCAASRGRHRELRTMRVSLDTYVWLGSMLSPDRITRFAREVLRTRRPSSCVGGPDPWRLRSSTASDGWSFPSQRRCSSRLDWSVTGSNRYPSSITTLATWQIAGSIITIRSTGCSSRRRNGATGITHACHRPPRSMRTTSRYCTPERLPSDFEQRAGRSRRNPPSSPRSHPTFGESRQTRSWASYAPLLSHLSILSNILNIPCGL